MGTYGGRSKKERHDVVRVVEPTGGISVHDRFVVVERPEGETTGGLVWIDYGGEPDAMRSWTIYGPNGSGFHVDSLALASRA
jgi:hypothetical protein